MPGTTEITSCFSVRLGRIRNVSDREGLADARTPIVPAAITMHIAAVGRHAAPRVARPRAHPRRGSRSTSSPSTCASTTRGARTKLSRTSSRFRIPRRPRAALTKSRCSPVFNMTTAASLDARSGAMPILDSLRADGICSQHDRPRDRGGQGRLSEILEILKSYRV